MFQVRVTSESCQREREVAEIEACLNQFLLMCLAQRISACYPIEAHQAGARLHCAGRKYTNTFSKEEIAQLFKETRPVF